MAAAEFSYPWKNIRKNNRIANISAIYIEIDELCIGLPRLSLIFNYYFLLSAIHRNRRNICGELCHLLHDGNFWSATLTAVLNRTFTLNRTFFWKKSKNISQHSIFMSTYLKQYACKWSKWWLFNYLHLKTRLAVLTIHTGFDRNDN